MSEQMKHGVGQYVSTVERVLGTTEVKTRIDQLLKTYDTDQQAYDWTVISYTDPRCGWTPINGLTLEQYVVDQWYRECGLRESELLRLRQNRYRKDVYEFIEGLTFDELVSTMDRDQQFSRGCTASECVLLDNIWDCLVERFEVPTFKVPVDRWVWYFTTSDVGARYSDVLVILYIRWAGVWFNLIYVGGYDDVSDLPSVTQTELTTFDVVNEQWYV